MYSRQCCTQWLEFMCPLLHHIKYLQLCKRQVNGIRRMDSHPLLPYCKYSCVHCMHTRADVSGAEDGSVQLWLWGDDKALCTPRAPGTYSKCTRIRFAGNGAQLALADGSGTVCAWQTSAYSIVKLKRPFFVRVCTPCSHTHPHRNMSVTQKVRAM